MACDIRSQRRLFGVIAERNGPTSYAVQLDDGRVWKRHMDHQLRRSEVGVENAPPSEIGVTPQAHMSVDRKHLERLKLQKKFRQLQAWPRHKFEKKTFREKKTVRKRKCVKIL